MRRRNAFGIVATLLGAFTTLFSTAGGVGPASAASLIGQSFSADIAIMGSDDNGPYDISVLNQTVTGPVVNLSVPVFKQLTFMGFTTPSTQIDGTVTLNIGANFISVNMSGQVQPFELESTFTGIGVGDPNGAIVGAVDSVTGFIPGVQFDLGNSFTANSLEFAMFYLGFQPGTNLTQTETLTFGAVPTTTPLPATLPLLATGLGGLGLLGWRRKRKAQALA